ncbi:MAG: hypothetical protein ABSC05_27295 [Candidatus Solibacter sp.]|jgi:tRNA(Ile)-lysidine synthase TilS/MesJ
MPGSSAPWPRASPPFTLDELDLSSAHGELEQAARDGRPAFFHDRLASGLAPRVVLGHTSSDKAETVLSRFLCGYGATDWPPSAR